MKLHLILIAAVLALCSRSFGGSERATAQVFGVERAAIIRDHERVRVSLLSQPEPDYHGKRVTERTRFREVPSELAAAAAAALLDDSNFVWDATTGTIPSFEARLIFIRGTASVAVDVSYSSYIRVRQHSRTVGTGLFRTDHAAVSKLVKSVFPNDKRIKPLWNSE